MSHDLKLDLARACIQLGADQEIRQTVQEGSWDEIFELARRLDREQLRQILDKAWPEPVALFAETAIRAGSEWLVRSTGIDEAAVIGKLQEFGQNVGCKVSSLLVVPTGGMRVQLHDIQYPPDGGPPTFQTRHISPAWIEAWDTALRKSLTENPGYDCLIVNALVATVPAVNRRQLRRLAAGTFLYAVEGKTLPWMPVWELACEGVLLELVYEDGCAQVSTKISSL